MGIIWRRYRSWCICVLCTSPLLRMPHICLFGGTVSNTGFKPVEHSSSRASWGVYEAQSKQIGNSWSRDMLRGRQSKGLGHRGHWLDTSQIIGHNYFGFMSLLRKDEVKGFISKSVLNRTKLVIFICSIYIFWLRIPHTVLGVLPHYCHYKWHHLI